MGSVQIGAGFMSEQAQNMSATPRRIRVSKLLVAILIALGLFVVIIIIAPSLFKGSRNGPINIDPFPNAQVVQENRGSQSDRRLYTTDQPIQAVYDYFSSRIPKEDLNGCQKIYLVDSKSEEPGYWYGKCVVDNSLLDASQTMTITINYQVLDGTSVAKTYFLIERKWGSQ
jgi:hypothetical protein